MLVVETHAVWSKRKTALAGVVVGAVSVTLFYGLAKVDSATGWGYRMPVWVETLTAIAVVLAIPIASVIAFYKRIPRLKLAALYALSLVLGWCTVFDTLSIIEDGFWKVLEGEERTLWIWVGDTALRVALFLAVLMPVLLLAWAITRLCRGAVIVRDGPVCQRCGYNLTGNVSGVCPECGTAAAKKGDAA